MGYRGEPATKAVVVGLHRPPLHSPGGAVARPTLPIDRLPGKLCLELESSEIDWLKRTLSILRIFSGFRLTRLPM